MASRALDKLSPGDAAVCAGEVCDLFFGCSVLFGVVEAADVLRVTVGRVGQKLSSGFDDLSIYSTWRCSRSAQILSIVQHRRGVHLS